MIGARNDLSHRTKAPSAKHRCAASWQLTKSDKCEDRLRPARPLPNVARKNCVLSVFGDCGDIA